MSFSCATRNIPSDYGSQGRANIQSLEVWYSPVVLDDNIMSNGNKIKFLIDISVSLEYNIRRFDKMIVLILNKESI